MNATSTAELVDRLSDDAAIRRPLCVALNGAVLRADPLWEQLLTLLRKQPWLVLRAPFWLLGGRAGIERALSQRGGLDAARLPYRADLVEALRVSSGKGRRILLLPAEDARLAQAVAEHLALFQEVITDESGTEMTQKRAALSARFADTGFDYVGHSAAELPFLADAQRGYLVGASSSAASRARALGDKVQVLSTRSSLLRAVVKVMRPHQWSKNALVVVPLALAPGWHSPLLLFSALLAAFSFSLCASAGYVFNDLIDIEADRAHRTKHRRPFASGDLPVLYGPALFFGLLCASFGIALLALPLAFVGMLGAYFVATLSYSLVLKSKLMLDVVVLAGLYTHRVLAGGIATGITVSAWLLAFSLFIFSSLAFAKRYIELRAMPAEGGQIKSRGYHRQDQEMVASMGPTAGYIAVLLFCLYIEESNTVTAVYRSPALLWFIVPILLYWISRVWFLAHRGHMQDDPVKFALADRRSWLCAAGAMALAAAARFW